MSLAIDATRALRNPQELTDLVQAVFNAQPQDESDWIEWKATLDLSRKETHGTIARHILGMSNRKPEDAARHAGGCGYVVIGVEPGNCVGVTPIDPAALGQGVLPYLGSEPNWSAQYVQVRRCSVLIVTVEPPQAGSRTFTLQKECPKPGGGTPYLAGAIFVRRPGRTIQAEPADIRALEDRFAAVAQPIALIVKPAAGGQSLENRPLGDVSAVLDPWLAQQRNELLPPTRSEPTRPAPGDDSGSGFRMAHEFERVAGAAVAAYQQMAPFLDSLSEPDRRTPEEYETEVESYLSESRTYYANLAYSRYAMQTDVQVAVELVNTSDRNYADVQVELHVPGTFAAHDPDLIVMPDDEPPERPRLRGARRLHSYLTPGGSLDAGLYLRHAIAPRLGGPVPKFRISNADGAKVTYEIGRVRPEQRILLDPIVLLSTVRVAVGDRAEAEWTVATGNVDGVARGAIELRIGQPVDPGRLIPELSGAEKPGANQGQTRGPGQVARAVG